MENDVSEKAYDVRQLSCKDLILLLNAKNDSFVDKEKIFKEFHRRFAERFYKKCKGITFEAGFSETLAEDIFQEAFIKLMKKIKDYTVDESFSEKKIENSIVKWFSTTANNEFINYIRKFKPDEGLNDDCDEIEDEIDDEIECEENLPLIRVKLREALATLSERERYILLTCANYGCLGNKNHLPDDVIDDIAKSFSIQKDYIKVLRFRALKKIRALILDL